MAHSANKGYGAKAAYVENHPAFTCTKLSWRTLSQFANPLLLIASNRYCDTKSY